MHQVIAYTDGCCLKNPGPGGWGALITQEGNSVEICGGEKLTTNNRMEMQAVVEVLSRFDSSTKVSIYTDSQYVKNGITSWVQKWKANGWRTSDKKPVKNQDLWERLDELCSAGHVTFHWVRGHNGDPGNERADALANMGALPYAK